MPSVQQINVYLNQTLYLQDIGTTVKVWLEGNGYTAYKVQSAYMHQGSVSIPVTVLGHSSFQVPSLGRWSDLVSTTGFTLPGNVILTTCITGEAPVVYHTGTGQSGVTSGVYYPSAPDGSTVLLLNFNGTDNATTWVESINNFTPYISDAAFKLDTSYKKFDSASLEVEGDGETFQEYMGYYPIPTITGDMTIHWWFMIEKGLTAWLAEAVPETGSHTEFDVSFMGLGGLGTPQGIIGLYTQNEHLVLSGAQTFLDSAGNLLQDHFELVDPISTEKVWHHLAFVVHGQYYNIALDGHFIGITEDSASGQKEGEWGRAWESGASKFVNNPFAGVNAFSLSTLDAANGISVRFDAVEILNCAKWIEDFAPPITESAGEFGQPDQPDTVEVFSTETITVSDNALVLNGDTLTINIGSTPIIYTFRSLPTGASNEILIGGTDVLTAANIAATLNDTAGAIFTATVSGNIVSVTAYTSETVTWSITSAGLTMGAIKQSVLYTTPDAVATLPAFTGNGFCADGTGFLPAFTGAGTCTQDDFCVGRGILPGFAGNAYSFIMGVNDASTDAQKISLLLYQNGFMQRLAPMVAVAGDVDAAALMAVQFVANYVTHTSDLLFYGMAENWVDPMATLYYGAGDCEDGSLLLASFLLNLDCPATSIKVAIGTYSGIGHAWVMYKRASDGLNVILDWTKGSTYWDAIGSLTELPVAFSEA